MKFVLYGFVIALVMLIGLFVYVYDKTKEEYPYLWNPKSKDGKTLPPDNLEDLDDD